MPTIEIVSFGSEGLNLNQRDFNIAIREDNKLVSHRGLFHDWLAEQKGVMVHLGNPELKGETQGGFYAGDIIDWESAPSRVESASVNDVGDNPHQTSRFRFLFDYQLEIGKIIAKALSASPEKTACFLTDIQLGAGAGQIEEMSLVGFWTLHDTKGLAWNTLYWLKG